MSDSFLVRPPPPPPLLHPVPPPDDLHPHNASPQLLHNHPPPYPYPSHLLHAAIPYDSNTFHIATHVVDDTFEIEAVHLSYRLPTPRSPTWWAQRFISLTACGSTAGSPVDHDECLDVEHEDGRKNVVHDDDAGGGHGSCSGSGYGRWILRNVSFRAMAGEVMAIAGPSGAGKSTLLEVVAGKRKPSSCATSILVNRKPMQATTFRRISGYVPQSDALFPLLTVRETLQFSAATRLASASSYGGAAQRVAELLAELRLEHVADSYVGSGGDGRGGLSGGERRRVSIGVDVVHDPAVLLLDEPTSGLDSASALHVVEMLHAMAKTRSRTIILSIHQPGYRIMRLIHSFLVLAHGTVAYHGSLRSMRRQLMAAGHRIPPHVNVLEYAIESIPAHMNSNRNCHASPAAAAAMTPMEKKKLESAAGCTCSTRSTSVSPPAASTNNHHHPPRPAAAQSAPMLPSASAAGHGAINAASSSMKMMMLAATTTSSRRVSDLESCTTAEENSNSNSKPAMKLSTLLQLEELELQDLDVGGEGRQYFTPTLTTDDEPSNNGGRKRQGAPEFACGRAREVAILSGRFARNVFRSKQLLVARSTQSLVAGLALGTLYIDVGCNERGVAERLGLFAFTLTFLLSSTVEALPIFLQERQVLMRETSRGAYRVSSYLLANIAIFIPFLLLLSLLFSLPLYWLVRLNPAPSAFLFFVATVWLVLLTANSFVAFLGALLPDYIMGNSVISGSMGAFFLFSGYFIDKHDMPPYWRFMHYISLFKYPLDALLINEYQTGLLGHPSSRCSCFAPLPIPPTNPPQNDDFVDQHPICTFTSHDVLRQLDLDTTSKWTTLLVILSFVFFYRFLCYVVLRVKVSRTHK